MIPEHTITITNGRDITPSQADQIRQLYQNGLTPTDYSHRRGGGEYSLEEQQERDPIIFIRSASVLVLIQDGTELIGLGEAYDTAQKTSEVIYTRRSNRRGEGLGSEILSALEQSSLRRGITTLSARIAGDNSASQGLAKKHGFTQATQGIWEKII